MTELGIYILGAVIGIGISISVAAAQVSQSIDRLTEAVINGSTSVVDLIDNQLN